MYPGQYYDAETGLHYNGWRYYEPGTGRYLRKDPIGIKGGINLYIYVKDNPVKIIDFNGGWSVSGGGYAGAGAEFSFNYDTCCEDGKTKKVASLTSCVGFGVGTSAKTKFELPPILPSLPLSSNVGNRGNKCPKTGDVYLEKSLALGYYIGAAGAVRIGRDFVEAEASAALVVGAEVVPIKACAINVLWKKTINDCCN
ncbi:MAG: RHS repeat-associated core domain-containing protein [Thermodesulfobacteriota bacterium]